MDRLLEALRDTVVENEVIEITLKGIYFVCEGLNFT